MSSRVTFAAVALLALPVSAHAASLATVLGRAPPYVDGGPLERTELIMRGPTQEARKIVYTMCRVDVDDVAEGESIEVRAWTHLTNDAEYKGERLTAGVSCALYWCRDDGCERIDNLNDDIAEHAPQGWSGGPNVPTSVHHDERWRWGKLTFASYQQRVSVHLMCRAYSKTIKSGNKARVTVDQCGAVAERKPALVVLDIEE